MIFPAYCWILKYYEWSLLERNANGHAYGTLCWSWQVHAPLTLSSKLYFFRRLPFGKLIFPPSHTTAFRSRLNICKIKKKNLQRKLSQIYFTNRVSKTRQKFYN